MKSSIAVFSTRLALLFYGILSGSTESNAQCSSVEFSTSIDGAPGPLSFNYVISSDSMQGEVAYEGKGWVGFAISPTGKMDGSLGVVGSTDFPVSNSNPGKWELQISGNIPLPAENQTITNGNITQNATHTVLSFTKLLEEPGEISIDPLGTNIFLLAVGSSNTPGLHVFRTGFPVTTDTTTCIAAINSAQPVEQEEAMDCAEIQFSHSVDGAPGALSLNYVISDDSMQGEVVYEGQAWVGFAISPTGKMDGSLGIVGTTEFPVSDSNPGKWELQISGNIQLTEDQQTLRDGNIVQNDTHTVLTFTKLLEEPGEISIDPLGTNIFLLAVGSSNVPGLHVFRTGFTVETDGETCIAQVVVPEPEPCTEVTFSHSFDDIPISFDYVISGETIQGEIVYEGEGWVGWGISKDGKMDGAVSVIGLPDAPMSASNPGKYSLTATSAYILDRQTLMDSAIVQNDTHTVLTFTKFLNEPGERSVKVEGTNAFLVAAGRRNALGLHLHRTTIPVKHDPQTCIGEIDLDFTPCEEVQFSHTFEGIPMTLEYFISDGNMQGTVVLEGQGWVGFGISETGDMDGSLGIIGSVESPLSATNPGKYELQKSGNILLSEDQQTLIDADIVQNNTHTVLTFIKLLEEPGEIPIRLGGVNHFLVAGGSSNTPGMHAYREAVAVRANPETCIAEIERAGPTGDAEAVVTTTTSDGPVDCTQFQTTYKYPDLPLTLHYVVNVDEETGNGNFSAQVVYDGQGWVGLGFSEAGGMVGSLSVIGVPDLPNSDTNPGKYDLAGLSPASVTLTDQQTLMDATIEQTDSQTILTFTKFLEEPGELPIDLEGTNFFIVAAGASNSLGFHTSRGSVGLSLAPCTADGVAEVGGPVEITVADTEAQFIAHGVLLAIGWGVLAPIAIGNSLCRNFIPGAGMWFKIHQAFNMIVTIFTMIGFFLGVAAIQRGSPNDPQHFKAFDDHAHRTVGLVVFILVLIQSGWGMFRPHNPPPPQEGQDPPKKSMIRIAWEYSHKGTGFALLAMSWYQVHTGLQLHANRFQVYDLTVVFWVIAGILFGIALIGFMARVAMGKF